MTGSSHWLTFLEQVSKLAPDILLLNEMPLGKWLATHKPPNAEAEQSFLEAHDDLVEQLLGLSCASFGSKPVKGQHKLSNEAFLVANGTYTAVHHKQYFPQETGWLEQDWFAPSREGFDLVGFGDLRIGALVCTELMFTEWARHYGRLGANLLLVPRATGSLNTKWRAAGAMAAIVSGCYVASSNRTGTVAGPDLQSQFGGEGFVFDPDGELIAQTGPGMPVVTVELDLENVERAKRAYPVYVSG
ncbi:hypothetical protein ASC76_10190 [Rhizobacter sp. Root404]|nr:hypothetical protein ASC76_10190 [Rhizobacter sp. Root404]